MTENPYRAWVEGFAAALRTGASIGPPALPARQRPAGMPGQKALLFSPHPDDEVIIGGLPLRLMRECGVITTNVAVTLGSNRDRRAARWQELQAACAYLGFGLVAMAPGGLEQISLDGRANDKARWTASVDAIAAVLEAERPSLVFLPHAADWNRTHVGVHHLVIEAMRRLPALACLVVETEYWGAMAAPNLMVESSPDDVATLVAALALHVGEVARNPYHLRLPGWMMDNVRRGAELVGGQGGAAPAFPFATLYRLRVWRDGHFHDLLPHGKIVGATDRLDWLVAALERSGAQQ